MSRLRQFEASGLRSSITFAGRLIRWIIFGISLVMAIAGSSLGVLVTMQLRSVPDVGYLEHYHPVDSIELYDKNDKLICTINQQNAAKYVSLKDISPYMQAAALAAEDRHFYEHHGVNVPSVVRALIVNLLAGKVVEGGSTITQQLVKNLFFPESGRTLVRKAAELIVAEQIEARYTKQQILNMYLNEIYFGNGAHGIEQAAEIYFGKNAAQLTLSESAFLAGLIKAPSSNGGIEHRQDALQRQREVLDAMAETGAISEMQARIASRSPLHIVLQYNRKEEPPFTRNPYYVSYVLDMVHRRFDDSQIRRFGLRVYTNLDPVAQQCAEQLLARDIKRAPKGIDEEALVAMSVKDGAVRAIVGGAGNYWGNQWNCATNAHTVGSAFKPFVYLTALLKGIITPETKIDDKPITVNQISMTWSPKNYDGKYLGEITVREALAKSRNTCAVRLAQMVGVDTIVDVVQKLDIDIPKDTNLSLALGTCAISPMQMAAAYGTFARGGIAINPWTVRHIDDLSGHVIDSYGPIACRVLPESPVVDLVSMMIDVVRSGSGTMARLSDRPVAGKTGTADKARDLWFIGFTPDMVTAVWGGNKNNQPIADKHATGGSVMASVWRDFNVQYYSRSPAPAGELIASKAKPAKPEEALAPIRIPDSDPASVGYATHSSAAVSHPSHGTIVRHTKGITDYTWSH